jgi:hypothetical protein
MKLFAGIVLLVIGIGLGYGLYMWAAGYAEAIKCEITLERISATVSGEENVTIEVPVELTIKYIMGARENVELNVSGIPSGVTVDFSPTRGVPDFYSNMTIFVTPAAEPGDYPLTISVIDTQGNVAASARFDLTIT